jgi:ABC-type phosphate transport system substrate-binding protein
MVRIRVRSVLSALVIALMAAAASAAPAGSERAAAIPPVPGTLVVIVHDGVPDRELSLDRLRRIFLVRERFWSNGVRIAPVNLPAGNAVREAFSVRVLGRSSRSLAAYWNDLYFHGTLPPPTVGSEQAVIRFVAATPGAIGYVTIEAASELPGGVRVVAEAKERK